MTSSPAILTNGPPQCGEFASRLGYETTLRIVEDRRLARALSVQLVEAHPRNVATALSRIAAFGQDGDLARWEADLRGALAAPATADEVRLLVAAMLDAFPRSVAAVEGYLQGAALAICANGVPAEILAGAILDLLVTRRSPPPLADVIGACHARRDRVTYALKVVSRARIVLKNARDVARPAIAAPRPESPL